MAPEDLSTERLLLLATGVEPATDEEWEEMRQTFDTPHLPFGHMMVKYLACRILAARIDKLGGAS